MDDARRYIGRNPVSGVFGINATISMYLTDLTTYVDERAVAFICGYASIEDEFDAYIETLKGMQVEELIKVKQAQYDRFAAAMK